MTTTPTVTGEQAALARVARAAAERLEDAPAKDVVAWAAAQFGDRLCVTSSFADAALVHLVSRVAPGLDVVFLDTGLHFAETLAVRDLVAATMPVRVRSIRPELTVTEQGARYGERLWATDPDRCCGMRKVAPLARALGGYDAWMTGLRRDDSPSRAGTPVVQYDADRGKVKVNPIARWSQAEVDAYLARFDVPVNALVSQGYKSVGCSPCTRPSVAGEDSRAGRWSGFEKTECGIHERS